MVSFGFVCLLFFCCAACGRVGHTYNTHARTHTHSGIDEAMSMPQIEAVIASQLRWVCAVSGFCLVFGACPKVTINKKVIALSAACGLLALCSYIRLWQLAKRGAIQLGAATRLRFAEELSEQCRAQSHFTFNLRWDTSAELQIQLQLQLQMQIQIHRYSCFKCTRGGRRVWLASCHKLTAKCV